MGLQQKSIGTMQIPHGPCEGGELCPSPAAVGLGLRRGAGQPHTGPRCVGFRSPVRSCPRPGAEQIPTCPQLSPARCQKQKCFLMGLTRTPLAAGDRAQHPRLLQGSGRCVLGSAAGGGQQGRDRFPIAAFPGPARSQGLRPGVAAPEARAAQAAPSPTGLRGAPTVQNVVRGPGGRRRPGSIRCHGSSTLPSTTEHRTQRHCSQCSLTSRTQGNAANSPESCSSPDGPAPWSNRWRTGTAPAGWRQAGEGGAAAPGCKAAAGEL